MAVFPKEAILRPQLFNSDSSPPAVRVGPTTAASNSSSTCQFRSLSWGPTERENRRFPLLLQSAQPIELHRGITRSEYAAATDQPDHREVVGLPVKSMCPKLFSALRYVEKAVEAELKAQNDRFLLARLTNMSRADPQAPSIVWVPLKPAFPCATLYAESDTKVVREVPARKLHETSGRYYITLQATSLYQPRAGAQWRIAYCVRSLVLEVSRNGTPLEMTACLDDQLPGFRFVSHDSQLVDLTSQPNEAPEDSTAAASAQTELHPMSPPSSPPPKKRKPASTPRKRGKQQSTTAVDWVETPPAKKMPAAGRSAGGTRVPSKDLAFAKQLASEAQATDNVSSAGSDTDSNNLD